MSEEEFDIKRPAPASERKTRDLTALSKTILPITKNIFGKKGFMEIEILTNWDKIVGEELADYSFPQKIDFKRGEKNNGVLHLQVPSGAFALEIQHRERYILDKINAYFGYNAVTAVKIRQNGSLNLHEEKRDEYEPPKTNLVTPEEKNYIESLAEDIKSAKLKEILTKLGQSIFNDNHNKKSD